MKRAYRLESGVVRGDRVADAGRFDRQRQILLTLLPLSDTERAAYLEKACAGDPKLRRDVESLLRVDADRVLPSLVQTGGVIESRRKIEPLPARIGPFQVLGLLGRGGMGVLRGRDTRLGREVALKILPQVFAGEPRLLARFRREAQLVAALNHPHIAQIYGLEESGGTNALVMELVEGTTLAERLDTGPLELSEALGIARQIAEAIEAAHERGIVHRDLKPANIMITTKGTVKILDFGVATALGPETAGISNSEGLQERPGDPPGLSVRGLGTPAYMSPEQLRKQPVTRCADVWAFGCVCFEMLSGRSAFSREKLADTLAAVLTRGPDWSLLPTTTPPVIRRLLSRCLRREESERLRDIGDVRILLDDIILDRTASVEVVPPKPPQRARWAVAAMAILGGLAGGLGLAGRLSVATREPIREPAAISARHDNVLAAPSASVIPSPAGQSESHSVGPETAHSSPGADSTNPSSPGVEAALHSVAPDTAPAAATLPPATPPPPLEEAAERDAVSRYLEEIEALQEQGKYWSDPQVLGRTVIDEALNADPSGFDRLIAANQDVRDSVARMNVPAPCAEHHSLTVALLDEGLSLLRDTRTQALSEDGTGLELMASKGMGIEAKARRVDARAGELEAHVRDRPLAGPSMGASPTRGRPLNRFRRRTRYRQLLPPSPAGKSQPVGTRHETKRSSRPSLDGSGVTFRSRGEGSSLSRHSSGLSLSGARGPQGPAARRGSRAPDPFLVGHLVRRRRGGL